MTEPKQINIYEISIVKVDKTNKRDTFPEEKQTIFILANNLKNAIEKAEMVIDVDELALDVKMFSSNCYF